MLSNFKNLGIDPRVISKIVLSHEHGDHTGGLKALVPFIGDAELYRLATRSPRENIRLIPAEDAREITQGVYTTGRLKGSVDEQSLVIKGKKGWYVLVGCSHPGVKEILTVAKQYGNIRGLIGGFHGFNDFDVVQNLDYICPCHCTAHKKDLKKAFPDKISDCGVGKIIDLNVVV